MLGKGLHVGPWDWRNPPLVGRCPGQQWLGPGKKLEVKTLSNFALEEWDQYLKIKDFRRVFLRDELPVKTVKGEYLIANLDGNEGGGTHWFVLHHDKQTTLIVLGYLRSWRPSSISQKETSSSSMEFDSVLGNVERLVLVLLLVVVLGKSEARHVF